MLLIPLLCNLWIANFSSIHIACSHSLLRSVDKAGTFNERPIKNQTNVFYQ